jgi:hypothetical protein
MALVVNPSLSDGPFSSGPRLQKIGFGIVDEFFFDGIDGQLASQDPGDCGGMTGDV